MYWLLGKQLEMDVSHGGVDNTGLGDTCVRRILKLAEMEDFVKKYKYMEKSSTSLKF